MSPQIEWFSVQRFVPSTMLTHFYPLCVEESLESSVNRKMRGLDTVDQLRTSAAELSQDVCS